MQCVRCQKALEQIDFRGIIVDECPGCHGRWFDRGELRKAKDHADDDLRWLDFDPFAAKVDQVAAAKEDQERCPKCSAAMTSLRYANSKVTIDKCGQCEGIWLNDGEFKKIISYLEDLVASHSASEYVIDSVKQLADIITGPEDKISEVKDFLVVLKLLKLRAAVEHSTLAAATNKIYQYFPFL